MSNILVIRSTESHGLNNNRMILREYLARHAEACKARYTELRHRYDTYMQRVRNHYQINNTDQVFMQLDSELICLFKFLVERQPQGVEPAPSKEKTNAQSEPAALQNKTDQNQAWNVEDDDLILIETQPELIVIEEDEVNAQSSSTMVEYRITKDMRSLVEHIKKYPEIYDTNHSGYNDYSHKSYIWSCIATSMGDKATKLMKRWIVMTTRFEWEVSRRSIRKPGVKPRETALQKLLQNFKCFLMLNHDTVYKQSYYLKEAWHVPIDYFSDIHELIERMMQIPTVMSVTEELLFRAKKNREYLRLWEEVANFEGYTAGQCEVTWLIMRSFYLELMKMRQCQYQLGDKWYFENIVGELYGQFAELHRKQWLTRKHGSESQLIPTKRRKQTEPSLNMNRRSAECLQEPDERITIIIESTTSTPPTTPPPPPPPPTLVEPAPLPKITSAISLAPQVPEPTVERGTLVVNSTVPTSNIPSAPLQPLRVNIPTDTLPFTLPKQTKLSAIIMPEPVAKSPTPPLVFSNVRAIVSPEGNIIKVPSGITIKSTNAKISPNPMMPSTFTTVPSVLPPLPRISNAVSLFNSHDDISVEIKGHSMFIECPSSNEKYQLPMSSMDKFIREVLSIPLIHYEHNIEPSPLLDQYWEHISKKTRLPSHVCRACWSFLKDKFYNIISLKDLMKPFVTTACVWTESFELFQRFDQHAVSHGWLEYVSVLPDLMKCIGSYPVLYQDVAKNPETHDSITETQTLHIWRTIGSRFPNINHITTIWTSFKNVFGKYMSDIEIGIDNKWHIHWWRVLAHLKFLIDKRYSSNEPYFYIVSNKMMKEIKRCAQFEL